MNASSLLNSILQSIPHLRSRCLQRRRLKLPDSWRPSSCGGVPRASFRKHLNRISAWSA